ncbi:MAG: transposase [Defluviicoccus sp.]|nr:transposase [Defluviicoccus sp.]
MATAEELPFSWRDVEGLADLARLRLVLKTLPDGEIVAALEVARGRGRNDYPVRAMWRRALIAEVVFQHASVQSLLRELGRNPALLEICGFDPLPYQGAPVTELRDGHAVTRPAQVRSTVPSHWNFSRFLGSVVRLEDERGLVSDMIGSPRATLFEEVPGFGRCCLPV